MCVCVCVRQREKKIKIYAHNGDRIVQNTLGILNFHFNSAIFFFLTFVCYHRWLFRRPLSCRWCDANEKKIGMPRFAWVSERTHAISNRSIASKPGIDNATSPMIFDMFAATISRPVAQFHALTRKSQCE